MVGLAVLARACVLAPCCVLSPSKGPTRSSAPACTTVGGSLDPEAVRAALEGASVALDVRMPAEYRLDGHIDGALSVPAFTWEHGYHLPSESFEEEVAAAVPSRQTPLICTCADGRLASAAQARLLAAGWECAVLEGGNRAWEEEGLPLEVDDDEGLVGAWV